MWYFQVKDSSIMTPRYFIHCFRSNAWKEPSLLLMLRLIFVSFFADLIIMKFVLPVLIDSLLISHHFVTLASSEFMFSPLAAFHPMPRQRCNGDVSIILLVGINQWNHLLVTYVLPSVSYLAVIFTNSVYICFGYTHCIFVLKAKLVYAERSYID